ncbi:MAG: hypothetical protein HY856_11320 [Burkholderiales bacterium]|nr:hypothetical protein [Burkholderiales bacterium]
MRYTTIACLDDLTRDHCWPAKELMYDLVRVPVFHACGMDLGKSPRRGQRHNLKPGFDAERFVRLCGPAAARGEWAALYHEIPAAAAQYLAAHVPEGALIVGYEMPTWLRRLLDGCGVDWLDMRLSPLRFASDLYMAFATNSAELHARIHPHAQRMDEVFAEAALMAAQVRYRQRCLQRPGPCDGAWVYVGQTEQDASLVDGQGRFVRVGDHADTLRQAVGDLPLFYKPHPLGYGFPAAERQAIERLLGRPVPVCSVETYELLAGEQPVGLIGLSSGVLQEAQWFGKSSLSLAPPICQPAFDAAWAPDAYLQIASHDFLSEPLWASILNPEGRRERPLVHAPRANHLRELHNTWWGYASHAARHSEFYRPVVAMHGGQASAAAARPATPDAAGGRDAQALRHELAQANARLETLRQEMDGLKDALRVVLRQTASRALAPIGTAPAARVAEEADHA